MYVLKIGSQYWSANHLDLTMRQIDAKRFPAVMVHFLASTNTILELFGPGARFVKLRPRTVAPDPRD